MHRRCRVRYGIGRLGVGDRVHEHRFAALGNAARTVASRSRQSKTRGRRRRSRWLRSSTLGLDLAVKRSKHTVDPEVRRGRHELWRPGRPPPASRCSSRLCSAARLRPHHLRRRHGGVAAAAASGRLGCSSSASCQACGEPRLVRHIPPASDAVAIGVRGAGCSRRCSASALGEEPHVGEVRRCPR